ncbi:hypothetical protein [Methylobacterium sp. 77]|uniref:hypothetical protein n=1 Tax=Methylobacterium sp. 77 TaxID=1101192 RepID=UPI000360846D|nr:hypothetical protein [Methylobacterium sp. 77]
MKLEGAPNTIQVLAIPHILDSTQDRVELSVLPGQSIAEMVDETLSAARALGPGYIRVTIDGHIVEAENWHRVRAKAGMHVLIRVVPQGDALKSVLTIALTVAAVAAGQYYALGLLEALSIGAGVATQAAAITNAILPSARISSHVF